MRGWITGTAVSALTAAMLVALPTAADIPATAASEAATTEPAVWAASSTASPASIDGRRCTKRGATRVVGADTFRCVGKGKKLTWKRVTPPAPNIKDGDACPTVGQRVSNPAGYLECRTVAGNRLVYRQLSLQPRSPGIAPSPEPIDTCRLRDMRPNGGRPPDPGGPAITEAIAYPVSGASRPLPLPNRGTVKIAVLPIDFSDVPGNVDPVQQFAQDRHELDAWIRHFSGGRMSYDWVLPSDWIRASKPSSGYQFLNPFYAGKPPPGTPGGPFRESADITRDLLSDVGPDVDLTGVQVLLFLYPEDVSEIWDLMTQAMYLDTPQLRGLVVSNATGSWLYGYRMPLWSWLAHELLHHHGWAGHAPYDASPLDIMTHQAGQAFTISTWGRMVLDWQDSAEISCVDAAKPFDHEVTLSPIDRDEAGTKAVMVRLSESEALVIESRRRDRWSSGFDGWAGLPDGFYGLTVTRVNTAVDRNRVRGPGGFMDLLFHSELNHGYMQVSTLAERRLSLNFLVFEGETVTADGVQITLLKSGDHDTVKVSRG